MHKKNTKALPFLAALAILLFALLLVSCAAKKTSLPAGTTATESPGTTAPTEHIHVYSLSIQAPSCTAPGYTYHTCACGDVWRDSKRAAPGHKPQTIEGIAPTCVREGMTDGIVCSVCGYTEREQTVLAPDNAVHDMGRDGVCTRCGVGYSEGLFFELNGDGGSYALAGIGTCTDNTVLVPPTYGGLPVQSVKSWLPTSSPASVIVLPEGIRALEKGAFYMSSNLRRVVLPESLRSIGESAFSCSGITSIVIPEGVRSIPTKAFECCRSLSTVGLPQFLISVGKLSFSGCASLEGLSFPERVEDIAVNALQDSSPLYLSVDENNARYMSRGNCLIEKATQTLIIGSASSVIPDDGCVTTVGEGAFRGNAKLTGIVIPGSILTVSRNAFRSCTWLKKAEIQRGVTNIGIWAFAFTKLEEIYLPETLLTLGNCAFKGSRLRQITLPDSIEKLGAYVFEECVLLRSCKLPRRLEYLPSGTFANCSSLEIICFGPFILGAKNNCYSGCGALKELRYEGKLDDFMQMTVSYAGATKIVASDGMWVCENGDRYFYYY